MFAQFTIFVITKIFYGTLFGAIMILAARRKKKNKQMERIFDTFTEDVRIDILESLVSYAKGEIAEIGNPANHSIEVMAASYGGTYFINISDFGLIDIQPVVAWTGPRPTHLPR